MAEQQQFHKRRTLACLIVAVMFALCDATNITAANPPPATRSTPPNIVLFFVDDLGYGDIGVCGQNARRAHGLPAIHTPNLDSLAAQGIRLTDFYGAQSCAPSRAALMTGLHNGHSYIRGNEPSVNLRREDTIIPELLRAGGYVTGMFGKWGLGESDETRQSPTVAGQIAVGHAQPLRKGFDEFFGYLSHTAAHFSYAPELLAVKGFRLWDTITNNLVAIEPPASYAPDLFVQRSLDFIQRNATNRFFIYLPLTPPHANATMRRIDAPEIEPEYVNAPWPETEKRFASIVTRLDHDVGLVLKRLSKLGLDQNTVVIFTSDNGAHAAGGHDYKFFNSTGPLRDRKFSLYEGGIRVPFIARWPGHIPAGVTSNHRAAVWDLLPTLCELGGSPTLPGIDGVSMLPTLLGKNSKQKSHDHLYWETSPNATGLKIHAARVDDWKAVSKGTNALELYNLAADIGEATNVAAANPAIVARMQALLANASTSPRHLPFPTNNLRTPIPNHP